MADDDDEIRGVKEARQEATVHDFKKTLKHIESMGKQLNAAEGPVAEGTLDDAIRNIDALFQEGEALVGRIQRTAPAIQDERRRSSNCPG